ncbi:MAG: MATE family efflux transporter [Deltaproteobacteria bacterium]|nr:MATE family efflux transporter [Deltaproteobacteria bacterium]
MQRTRAAELRTLFAMSAPIALAQVGHMAMGVVDTLMIARVGVPELAAVAVASTWVWSSGSIAQGIVQGMDPLVSQAHGAGDGNAVALAFQRGLVIAVLVSLPLMALWLATEPALLALGQDPEVARLAGRYMLARLPSAVGFLLFTAQRQYLAGRAITRPAMWIMLLGNGFNALFNWILIFGHFGAPPLGVVGAGLATSFTNLLLPIALFVWIRRARLYEGAWRAWDRRSFALRGLAQSVRLGLPIGIQMALEANAFTIAMLLVGSLGVAELAAHQVVINMASLTFMFPLGIAIGASARAGNLIGARDAAGLRLACGTALVMGGGIMTIAAVGFVAFREALPRLYVEDLEVVSLAASLLPIAGAFQIFDGIQVVGGGLMRGMGRPQVGAVANLLAFYLIGLPLAWGLAFRAGLGIRGIWWGLAAGLLSVAAILCVWVARTSRRPLSELSVAPEGA